MVAQNENFNREANTEERKQESSSFDEKAVLSSAQRLHNLIYAKLESRMTVN